jgi:hypothetical protein
VHSQYAVRLGRADACDAGATVKAPGSAHECFVPQDADALIAVVQAGFEIIEKP